MLVSIEPVRGKAQHLGLSVQITSRNEEDFSSCHGVRVEVAFHTSTPVVHHFGWVIERADRTNRIQMRGSDLVDVYKPCPTNLTINGVLHRTDRGRHEPVPTNC